MSERTLSKRGQKNLPADDDFKNLVKNLLMHEELASYINKLPFSSRLLTYGDGPFGTRALRSALSNYFNDYFSPIQEVFPEHILVANGVSSIIDLVIAAIADDGDGILIGRPLYTGYAKDVSARARAKLVPVSAEGVDPMGEEMVEQCEKELQKQVKAGTKIAGIILCNSTLSIPTNNLIDPALVHILYGMSKDFSSNGLRCGVLLSQSNPSILACSKSIAVFAWPTSTTEYYWTSILNDRSFLDYYFAENSRRLAASYARVTSFFTDHGIKWIEGSNAGFFLWADFRGLLGADIIVNTEESEQVEAVAVNERPSQIYKTSKRAKKMDEWFFRKLLEAKVFIASGDAFFAEEHGWYRITFSLPEKVLLLGLERLESVLEEVKREGGPS
ncbi:MAG: hypothetical protein Q9182_002119 [Xanthomendoza sp. 2 TL-2023]